MNFSVCKMLSATAVALVLAGCVDPMLAPTTAVPAEAAAAAPNNAALYAAQADGTFSVPAVPVEKVPAAFQRQDVAFASAEPVGTIIINPAEKHLYLITGKNTATQYGIAVGKAGFQWSGVTNITNRKHWPTWTPPKEMIERKPELVKWEKGQPGGPTNPLGARALYLTTNGVDYGYRIHGTPDWWSIGKNASSGCIRMINQDVMDLYTRVPDGAKVVVLNADGSYPSKLKLPPPVVKAKPKATPAPAATPVITPSAIVVAKPAVMPMPVITTAPARSTPEAAGEAAEAVAAAATKAAVTPVCAVPLVNGICPPIQ